MSCDLMGGICASLDKDQQILMWFWSVIPILLTAISTSNDIIYTCIIKLYFIF